MSDQRIQWIESDQAWKLAEHNSRDNLITFFTKCPATVSGSRPTPELCKDPNSGELRGHVEWQRNGASVFVTHEFGHALGIHHDSCGPDSIMSETLSVDRLLQARLYEDQCTLVDFLNCDPAPDDPCPDNPQGISQSEVTATGLTANDWLAVHVDLTPPGNSTPTIEDTAQFTNGDATVPLTNIPVWKEGDRFSAEWEFYVNPGDKSCELEPTSDTINAAHLNEERLTFKADCCPGGSGSCGGGRYPVGGNVRFVHEADPVSLVLTATPPQGSDQQPVQEEIGPFSDTTGFQFNLQVEDGWTWGVQQSEGLPWTRCLGSNLSGTIQGQGVNNVQFNCVDHEEVGFTGPFIPDYTRPPGLSEPWDLLGSITGFIPWWEDRGSDSGTPDGCTESYMCPTSDPDSCELIVACGDGSTYAGPSLSVTSPVPGETVSGVIDVAGTAIDPQGVVAMLFYVDDEPVSVTDLSMGPSFSARLNTAGLANGSHRLQVLAFDGHPTRPVVTWFETPIEVGTGGGGAELDVFLNWNSRPIADGGVYQMGESTPPGVTISRRFRLENNGTGTLFINNPANLINDSCFSQRSPVLSAIPPGGQDHFWVDLNCQQSGTRETTVTIESNDADESPYTFLVRGFVDDRPPQMSVEVDGQELVHGQIFTFPNVEIPPADDQVKIFRVCNDGQGPLFIHNPDAMIQSMSFSPFVVYPEPPDVISAGSCVNVPVIFGTTSTGTWSATLVIESNDPHNNSFEVSLDGESVAVTPTFPEIRVTAGGQLVNNGGSVQYPPLMIGAGAQPIRMGFQVCNDGDAVLELGDGVIDDNSWAAFTHTPLPNFLNPGSCGSFAVDFFTTFGGSYTSTLSFSTNDFDENPFEIVLVGETAMP